jgi:hypothetical protein
MRKQILFLCIAFGVLFVSAMYIPATYNQISTTGNSQPVDLKDLAEKQNNPRLRSLGTPITVELQGDMLLAYFQEHVGVVQVAITNKWGESVFTTTVNAATQPSLTISLMELPEGSYVITFSNADLSLSGEFEIIF